MRSRTPRFDRVIYTPHLIASRVDVLFNRTVVAGMPGIPVVAGEVQYDRNSAVMARSTIQVACNPDANPRLLPTATAGGPLSPYGYELQPWRGIRYGSGTDDVELISLGIFPTQRTSIDAVSLLATVEGSDRSQQVIDARLEADHVIPAGTNTGVAIEALIAAGVTGLTYAFQSTTNTTPLIVWPTGTDRWEAAQQMARDISCELFFDHLGRCVLQSEPGAGSTPEITLRVGDGGQLTAAQLVLDREGTYNRVIATGENSQAATVYRGVATVADPGSEAYYDGGFGRKVRFYASPFIASNEQAASAAASILTTTSGLERGLSFTMLPNPAISPGTIARIVLPALDIDELHIIDRFPMPLNANALVEVG